MKSIPYSSYRRYLLMYQIIATVLVCLPVFLSIFLWIGIPHFLFLILTALIGRASPGIASRVLHALMFLYYALLLLVTLKLWPEIRSEWVHADSVDVLIRIQMTLMPLVLTIQLGIIAFGWIYPILKPHELLEQQTSTPHRPI
ncbi:MAG: hypothetical protein ACYC1Q_03280 [Bacteroidia bacterium]